MRVVGRTLFSLIIILGLNVSSQAARISPRDSLTTDQASAVKRSHLRTEALVKYGESAGGGVAYNKSTGLSVAKWTASVKMEMETDFNSVRLFAMNRASTAVNGVLAVVGVTETDSTSSSNNMSVPVIGGTAYAQLQTSGNVTGFKSVTWSGASSLDLAAATTGQVYAISDRIPLTSIPRASGQPSTRPFLLWRTYIDGTTYPWAFVAVNALTRTPTAALRNRVIQVAQSSPGADYVTTLTGTMILTTNVNEIYPIVGFVKPVLSVWGVGDSITSSASVVADGQSSWGFRACLDVSTPEHPCVWANMGHSSNTSATYWASAKAMLAAGVPPPSVLIIGPTSVNDGIAVDTVQTMKALAIDVLATARTYNIPYVIFWPLLPRNTYDATQDARRLQLNADMQAMATAYGIGWISGFGPLGDGATPERWVPGYNYTSDGIHPNETAIEDVMAPALKTILRALVS